MFVDSMVIDFFTNEMALVKINGKADSITTEKYHISAYPTSVMIRKNGEEIDRVVGYMKPEAFLQKLRDYSNGIGTLDDLLAKNADNFTREIAFEIGEKYKYRGGQEEASSWFQKVIDTGDPIDSLSGESRMALASVPYRNKDYDGAIKDYEAIMKDFKGTPFAEESEIWRAYIFKRKGDTATAITAFEAFVEHYPESEDVEWVEKQISNLKGEENKEKPKEESGESSGEESKGEEG